MSSFISNIPNGIVNTPIANIFFSTHNVETIQYDLIDTLKTHGYIIGPQSYLELLRIMETVFTLNANEITKNPLDDIKRLNQIVVNNATPKILTEIQQYLWHKVQIDNDFHPNYVLDNPINTNTKNMNPLVPFD